MSLYNNYPNRKDKRKKYYKSQAFDRSCRPGGDCSWCEKNRTYSNQKREQLAQELLEEFEHEPDNSST